MPKPIVPRRPPESTPEPAGEPLFDDQQLLAEQILESQPAEQLMNYQRLVARTVDVFGDEVKASRWLSLPNSDLNGESPLRVAQRANYSVLALEPILVRIEHGIDF